MFKRTLLDNEYFLATAGPLGGITVTLKGGGLVVKANELERTKLLDIGDEIKRQGGAVGPDSKQFKQILDTYCESLLGQGDPRWNAFFLVMSCEDIVNDHRGE